MAQRRMFFKTIYLDEQRKLGIDENGRYFEKNEGNESVIPTVTSEQVSIETTTDARMRSTLPKDCQDVNSVDNSEHCNDDDVVLCKKCNLKVNDIAKTK